MKYFMSMFSFITSVIIKERIKLSLFLFVVFSCIYFSFFPGSYSPDSIASFMSVIGCADYNVGNSPILSVFWKIWGNISAGPFLSFYLLILLSFILQIKKNNYFTSIFLFIGLLMPAIMKTIVFAWKDNALMVVILLFISYYDIINTKKHNGIHMLLLIFILFFAFMLRLNAVFAVIPLIYLFYLNNKKYKILSVILTVLLFIGLNQVFNTFIFKATKTSMDVSIPLTDIVKVNHKLGRIVIDGIPTNFVVQENNALATSNINKMFEYYNEFRCNDILYMYPKWRDAYTFVTDKHFHDNDIRNLRKSWLLMVVNNPATYLQVRLYQWFGAISIPIYSDPTLSVLQNKDFLPNCTKQYYDSNLSKINNYKIISAPNKTSFFYPFINTIKIAYINDFTKYVSLVIVYIIIELILLVILFRIKSEKLILIKACIISGLLYAFAYIFIMPCTDYRYFLWTIISCFLSSGMLIDFMIKKLEAYEYNK